MDEVLEEGPSQEDLDAIRAAVQELCNKKRAAGFKVSDLKLLYENRYHDLDCLEIATRDGLKDSGLKPGLIDAILEGQKERRKEKAEKPPAGQEDRLAAAESSHLRVKSCKTLVLIRTPASTGSILGKRRAEEYFKEHFSSASELSRSPAAAMRAQKQLDGQFDDGWPLVANGRCKLTRCPVGLVHEIFATAVRELSDGDLILSQDDWDLYKSFHQVLPNYHKKEEVLVTNISPKLRAACENMGIFWPEQIGTPRGQKTDFIIQGPRGGWLCIVEFKTMQDEAELQVARYYRDYAERMAQGPAVTHWDRSVLPCLGLEVVGHELRLGAFWFEVCPCFSRLACAEFRLNSSYQEERSCSALLRAWSGMMKRLNAFYSELPAERTGLSWRDGVPYILREEDRFTNVCVVGDEGYPSDRAKYRLYKARDVKSGNTVIVKFAERVRLDGHKLWAYHGLAVKLVDAIDLPGGYSAVVMEFLSQEDGWSTCDKVIGKIEDTSETLKGLLVQHLHKAHELRDEKNRCFVHGDARSKNFLVRVDGSQVREVLFIDLDWCGIDGDDVYIHEPNPLLAPETPRPEAVRRGATMVQEHDRATLLASMERGFH